MDKRYLFLLLGAGLMTLSSCGPAAESSDTMLLRVYNWEDYISEDPDVISAFEDYVYETDGVRIKVVYDTFDTNETMLSQLETGASTYDLLCPSDYMIQRLAARGMLEPFAFGEEREALYTHGTAGWEDSYSLYTSPYLQDQFEKIKVKVDGKDYPLSSYAKGYMWGTLGLIYHPAWFTDENSSTYEEDIEQVKIDMYDWNSLWDEKYHGSFQIKDSMRDTYAVGIMHGYDEEFQSYLDLYEAGEISAEEYKDRVNTLFNNIVYPLGKEGGTPEEEEAALEEIEDHMGSVLMDLRNNSYGLEVDSGKQDIVVGRTGIGIAWSGDAVWSMDLGDNEEGIELYYSVPKTGANIWFDGWCMPKSDSLNKEYAQKFVDFLARPEIASLNMDYIGYTSFSGGDDILSLIREWYDPRTYEMYQYLEIADESLRPQYWEEEGILYDEETREPLYLDGSGDEDGYIYEKYEIETETGLRTIDVKIYVGTSSMEGSTYEEAVVDGVPMSWDQYNEENELGWTKRDLGWFFDDTLVELEDSASLLYSDEIEILVDKDGDEFEVGRQFYAQYPSEDMLSRLCIMEDYGANNAYVLRLWEEVKAGTMETWVIVVFSLEVGIAALALSWYLIGKARKKSLRLKRREEAKKA